MRVSQTTPELMEAQAFDLSLIGLTGQAAYRLCREKGYACNLEASGREGPVLMRHIPNRRHIVLSYGRVVRVTFERGPG